MTDPLTGVMRRLKVVEDYLWKKKTYPVQQYSDVSTTQHGFVPIAPNNGYSRLLDTGLWGVDPDPFGDGNDGDVVIAASASLTRDMRYHNLTINAGQRLDAHGYRIYVSGTLTINATGYISFNGEDGSNGSATGGAGGASVNLTYAQPFEPRPRKGANGASAASAGTANGSVSTAVNPSINNGNVPLNWNSGGGGGGGAAHGTTPGNGANPSAHVAGAIGGVGGAATGSDNVQLGGGGGGAGGGVLIIAAKTINNAGTIEAKGGAGGSGATSASSKGGNGGGGGGGSVIVFYRSTTGSGVGTMLATGGAAGISGNGGTVGADGSANSFQV